MGYCNECMNGKKRGEDGVEDWEVPHWIRDDQRYCSSKKSPVDDYHSCPDFVERGTIIDCYITTAACTIIGIGRDNVYLDTFKEFKQKVLRKNEKYFKLLVLYDVVGPKISKALLEDPDKEKIAIKIMAEIKRAYDLLIGERYEEAINNYITMTLYLADYYKIEVPEITDELVSKVDIEKSGDGKLVYKMK